MATKPTLWQVFCSTLAAFFGVQSERNRTRDFESKSIIPYVFIAIFSTALFIILVIGLVNAALYLAT
ncbi:DUF2970 domain-containing protein [Neptunomonas marina]|uniref:DUF2970 domain-containing protein n=1 Tax=Neptunomonas marina TaxID=1815562 RepID=A0A437QAF9_9GAMM|nr:DUF2970 domain-containing protein [Neptunomonas marina]RVU31490.1 DUF2970 domain-containing protein [Neptunomonas marina]